MSMNDYDGQMKFGDLVGLNLPDICLTDGEEKKNLAQEICPGRGHLLWVKYVFIWIIIFQQKLRNYIC